MEPGPGAAVNARHVEAVLPLLDAATRKGEFFSVSEQDADTAWQGALPPHGTYHARYGIVDAEAVHTALSEFRWTPNYDFVPSLDFLRQLEVAGGVTDWLVVLPVPTVSGRAKMVQRTVSGRGIPVGRRARRTDRAGFVGSDPKRRDLLEIVTGGYRRRSWGPLADALLETDRFRHIGADLAGLTRGALLLNFAADARHSDDPASLPDPADLGDVATIFTWALPYAAAPAGRIAFSVRTPGAGATVALPTRG